MAKRLSVSEKLKRAKVEIAELRTELAERDSAIDALTQAVADSAGTVWGQGDARGAVTLSSGTMPADPLGMYAVFVRRDGKALKVATSKRWKRLMIAFQKHTRIMGNN